MFVRGDTHGNFDFLPYWCEKNLTTKNDMLVILGDSGINFRTKTRNDMLKQYIAQFDITLLCVRGNHDRRPENVAAMKKKMTPIGEVYTEDEYPNIWYAIDGNEYNWNGKNFLTIGGAYSVDKHFRLENGWTWFKDEQLSAEEMKNIANQVAGRHFDYVFTHTCPFTWQPTDMFLSMIDQNSVDSTMEHWFEELSRLIEFDNWYFGHYHTDRDVSGTGKIMLLFNNTLEIV